MWISFENLKRNEQRKIGERGKRKEDLSTQREIRRVTMGF